MDTVYFECLSCLLVGSSFPCLANCIMFSLTILVYYTAVICNARYNLDMVYFYFLEQFFRVTSSLQRVHGNTHVSPSDMAAMRV